MKHIELTTIKNKSGHAEIKHILYFIFLPFAIGGLFFFLYVCKGDISLFKAMFVDVQFDFDKVYASWLIGYEFLAIILLIKIFLVNDKGELTKAN